MLCLLLLSLWPCVREDWDEGLRDKLRLLHACPALQPEELTNALEISNIVFTSLFALEMLLKLLVYGPFGYIKNPYNIFDGVIVVIRYDYPFTASHLGNTHGEGWGEEPHSLFPWDEGVWSQAPLTHGPWHSSKWGLSGPPMLHSTLSLGPPCSGGTWLHIVFGRAPLQSPLPTSISCPRPHVGLWWVRTGELALERNWRNYEAQPAAPACKVLGNHLRRRQLTFRFPRPWESAPFPQA